MKKISLDGIMRGVLGFTALAAIGVPLLVTNSSADSRGQAIRLFDRLAGVPIMASDPRLAQMQALIDNHDMVGAAEIASQDDHFFNLTMRRFAAPMSNRNEDPLVQLNDFIATVVGITRDDIDARAFFTGNFIYKSSVPGMINGRDIQNDFSIYRFSDHFQFLDQNKINLRQTLVQAPLKVLADRDDVNAPAAQRQVPFALPDPAGLITSNAWAAEHFFAGTNRRVTEFIFQEFLCTPIPSLRDGTMVDNRVHRDVARNPSGNVNLYQTSCRTCHGGLDGNTGAFAYFDTFDNDGKYMVYSAGSVRDKMNKNGSTFTDGFVTVDDTWINHYVKNQNVALGWHGPTEGKGANALGRMFSETDAFPSCMAQRAFTAMCKRPPADSEKTLVASLAARSGGNI